MTLKWIRRWARFLDVKLRLDHTLSQSTDKLRSDNSLFQIVLIERGFVIQSRILLYIKETDGRPNIAIFIVIFKVIVLGVNGPAGTRRLCNVRLTLDMTSDRRCILVENENRVDVNIWRWLNVGFWLHNLKTTKSQHQLTSVLDINLTLTLDYEFTFNFGHPTSQPKFNQISTSYGVVCLLGGLKTCFFGH